MSTVRTVTLIAVTQMKFARTCIRFRQGYSVTSRQLLKHSLAAHFDLAICVAF